MYDSDSEFSAVMWDTTIVPAIKRLLNHQDEALTLFERHPRIAEFQFRSLTELRDEPGPKFVFAHILLPHSPYVFRADGRPVTGPEAGSEPESDLYAGQLAYTDSRIKETVEHLLAGPPEDEPIIIVQGDEGPYARKDVDWSGREAEYLQVRFGILNAMYLPGAEPGLVHSSITSVNTFRLVFANYFRANLPLLPDRSFTWPDNDHTYDFVDVTDLVATPPDVPPLGPEPAGNAVSP
jgi:membrane-anchored protein YejM (alkaline phosphatase superfamily)